MQAFVNDFKYAQTTSVAVEVGLLNGEKLIKGVHDVNEDEGFVSLYSPQTFGDNTTTMKVPLDLVASVIVTDVSW